MTGRPQGRLAYSALLARMRAAARGVRVAPRQGAALRPLEHMNVWEPGDFSDGLFSAWAIVGDVLGFYQERIAAEGYLDSATELRSVAELARTVGGESAPATSARAWLVLTTLSATGAPESVTIPASSAVQSAPEPGQSPTVFETTEPLVVRRSLNALRAFASTRLEQDVPRKGDTSVRISGVHPQVKPGLPLVLAEAPPEGGGVVQVRVLTAVERDRAGGFTRLRWRDPLGPGRAGDELASPSLVALTRELGVFGARAPRWDSLPEETKFKFGTRLGGVFRQAAGDTAWTAVDAGLPSADVRALLAVGTTLHAATSRGIFRSEAAGPWTCVSDGLPRRPTFSLGLAPGGDLLAGTSAGGVFRSGDGGQSWDQQQGQAVLQTGRHAKHRPPSATIRAVAVVRGESGAEVLLAATDGGVCISHDRGASWISGNKGLPGHDPESGVSAVRGLALLVAADLGVVLGTDRGLFRSTNLGLSWRVLGSSWQDGPAAPREPALRRVLDRVLHPLARAGSPAAPGSAHAPGSVNDVTLLRTRSSGNVLLAATSVGLFRSTDHGDTWVRVPIGDASPGKTVSVTKLAAVVEEDGTSEVAWACTSDGVVRVKDGVATIVADQPRATAIVVDAAQGVWIATPPGGVKETEWPGFELAGRHLPLERQDTTPADSGWVVLRQDDRAEALRYSGRVTTTLSSFMQQGTVSELELDQPLPAGFDRRLVGAWIRGVALRPYRAFVADERPLRGASIQLAGAQGDLVPGAAICITGPPPGPHGAGAPDSPAPAATREVVRIASVTIASDGASTTLALQSPLAHAYDPGRVAVSGNVVAATQGETILDEIVGSGNASGASQRFVLARTGLAVPPGAGAPVVSVRVTPSTPSRLPGGQDPGGVNWTQVPTLAGSGPHDRHFVVRAEPDGRWSIAFGDGVQGARLPTGLDNVHASYRIGAGPDGNVKADRLILLRGRPPGIQRVTNPLPATGGEVAGDVDATRRAIPAGLSDLGRAVALRDFETLAKRVSGVAFAQARLLRLPQPTACVSLVAAGPEEGGDDLAGRVRGALLAARLPRIALLVVLAEPVPLQLGLRVLAAAPDAGGLERSVQGALQRALVAPGWPIAASMADHDVVRLVQDLEGVLSVELTRFGVAGDGGGVVREVEARSTGVDGATGRVLPAQRIVLDPASLPAIEVEVA